MTDIDVVSEATIQVKKRKLQKFQNFLYNKEEHTFCSRTSKSWGLIILYYVVFYSVLSGLFAIMLAIFFFGMISKTEPYRSGAHSIISLTAGTNVYPRLSVVSGLVISSTNTSDSFYQTYNTAMASFFNLSFNSTSSNVVNCPTDGDQPNDIMKFCRFTKDFLGPCADPIGQMVAGKICVFVRVNKVYGWLPKPTNMLLSTNILVNCSGQNPGDTFALGQPVYYPSLTVGTSSFGVIGTKFFPYVKQPGYVSPMVAVQFPAMKRNIAILIQCQVVNLDNTFLKVNFEVMVYDKNK